MDHCTREDRGDPPASLPRGPRHGPFNGSTLGGPLPDDSLEPSEAVLPASDATLEEVRGMLREDGLIPGTPTA